MPEEPKGEWKIDYRSLILGIILNILTIIVFILLYHAYFVAPKYQSQTPTSVQQITPGENAPVP